MPLLGLLLLIVLNLPLFGLLSGIFFRQEGLLGALRYLFIPDLLSLFRGEYIDDQWAEAKLLLYALVCGLTISSELDLLASHFPRVHSFFIF